MARSKKQKTTNSAFNRDIKSFREYLQKDLVKDVVVMSESAIVDTLKTMGKEAFDVSQRNVPRDDGDLASTGVLSEVERNGNTWKISIKYGEGLTNYAFFVHENMPHDRGSLGGPAPFGAEGVAKRYTDNDGNRGPKYLERAMDEVFGNEGDKLKSVLRENLRKVSK